MAITSSSCPSSVYLSYYICLKKLNMKRVSIKVYPVRDPLLVPLGVKTINFLWGGTLYHNSLVIPNDAHISLVLPNDAHISLVLLKDAQQVVIS